MIDKEKDSEKFAHSLSWLMNEWSNVEAIARMTSREQNPTASEEEVIDFTRQMSEHFMWLALNPEPERDEMVRRTWNVIEAITKMQCPTASDDEVFALTQAAYDYIMEDRQKQSFMWR